MTAQQHTVQQQEAETQTQAALAANEQQGKAAVDDAAVDEAAAADEATTDEAAVDEVAQMAAAKNEAYEEATEAEGFARSYDG